MNKSKKIKLFSSYCSEEQIFKNITGSWGKGEYVYKDLEFTTSNEYTHAVLFNTARHDKAIPKGNVIGFSHEPRQILGIDRNSEYIDFVKKNVYKYFISNSSGLPNNFIEKNTFICPFEYGKSENESYNHKNKMSMILSMKTFAPGHKMRHKIMREILKTDADIHFYGKGLNEIYEDERVKDFDWDIFNIPYENYKYQIVIENLIDNKWSSEKLTNCIIKETIPIYYGSSDVIKSYYSNQNITFLNDDIKLNVEKILNIYNDSDACFDTIGPKKKLYREQNLMEFIYNEFIKND